MVKKIVGVIGIFLFLEQVSFSDDATRPGAVFTMGTGARPAGMGQSFVAIADDSNACFYNPAGLSQIKDRQISTMTATLTEDRKYNSINAVSSLGEKSTLGISWLGFEIGPIEKWDINNNFLGTFTARQDLYILSYGMGLKKGLSLGANIKSYSQKIDTYSSYGMGFDLGVLYNFPSIPKSFDSFSVGLLFQDLGGTYITWNTGTKETLPNNIKFGIGIKLMDEKLVCAMDYDKRTNFHTGLEYWINNMIGLRLGTEKDNFTFGTSLTLQNYEIHYAFVQEKNLGDGQRVSLGIHF